MADLKLLAWAMPSTMAIPAPATPAKKEEIQKESILWRARLMPMASAAISFSRMALKARP